MVGAVAEPWMSDDQDKLDKARERIRRLGLHHHRDQPLPTEAKRPEVGKFTLAELLQVPVAPTVGKHTSMMPIERPEPAVPVVGEQRPQLPALPRPLGVLDGADLQLDPEGKLAAIAPF